MPKLPNCKLNQVKLAENKDYRHLVGGLAALSLIGMLGSMTVDWREQG